MIRHPLHSAVGHTRPDLCRVTDGIAASLRKFSVSARRSNPDDKNDDPNKPNGRQRAAAAVDELIATVERTVSFSKQTLAPKSGPSLPQTQAQRSNVINVKSLPRGGLNGTGFRRLNLSNTGGSTDRSASGPNIIRGGFRGRGQGPTTTTSSSFGMRGPRPQGREGGGVSFNRDDRPRRARGSRAGGGSGGRRRRRYGEDREDGKKRDEEEKSQGMEPRVKAYLDQKEMGTTMAFNPSLSLESLTGWGPAVATSGTPFGQGEIVMRQARILGGGQHFHPQYLMPPDDIRAGYRDGTGIFVPPSEEAKQWTKQVLKDKPIVAPPEVKTAILEDALLGKYDGPKYADPKDTVGTIRSYVKRDGTWNVQAERRIEEKVSTLLPASRPTGQAGGQEARPKA
ncbi:hypothetical protein K449DRAFT_381107 [Hypoxylon sp. EC38]|nr:hypothetical protein K449DRAFT_381107 [Hypoxylon sp. EC38]